jgi:hypothetical protein
MARSLSQRGAQLLRGPITIGDEVGAAPQVLHQPGRGAPAGFQVAGEVHAAHHALPRIFRRTRQDLRTALGHHVRQ